jgi:hypothetical protein
MTDSPYDRLDDPGQIRDATILAVATIDSNNQESLPV